MSLVPFSCNYYFSNFISYLKQIQSVNIKKVCPQDLLILRSISSEFIMSKEKSKKTEGSDSLNNEFINLFAYYLVDYMQQVSS